MLLAGLLNIWGERHPELTGRGQLQPGQDEVPDLRGEGQAAADPAGIAASVLFIAALYLAGVAGNDLCGLPAPVGMVFLAVATKLLHWAPAKLQKGCGLVYKFSSVALTYPTLFAVSLAITPWDKLVGACAPRYLITVVTVVIAMTATGYALARRLRMYPVDLAIVTSCRCSKGGAGDVAILDTANRMELMPFAQTATRIGGAVTVTLALIALRRWH
jgi:Na+/citrate or Na+/malate symporter